MNEKEMEATVQGLDCRHRSVDPSVVSHSRIFSREGRALYLRNALNLKTYLTKPSPKAPCRLVEAFSSLRLWFMCHPPPCTDY